MSSINSGLWWPMRLINLSILFRSLQNSEKYAELAFCFCFCFCYKLGKILKGFLILSKHLQKYSARFINMQLLIIEKNSGVWSNQSRYRIKILVDIFLFQSSTWFFLKKKLYLLALFTSKNVDPGQWAISGMDCWSLPLK